MHVEEQRGDNLAHVGVLPDIDGEFVADRLAHDAANAAEAGAAESQASVQVRMIVVAESREFGDEEVVVTMVGGSVFFDVGEILDGEGRRRRRKWRRKRRGNEGMKRDER